MWLDTAVFLLCTLLYCWFIVAGASLGRLYNNAAHVPPAEAALVLGTSQWREDGSPNLFFRNRMDAAARLFHSGKVKYLVVSGDNHARTYDEPAMMRRALMKRGVPDCRIISDYAGFRTFDSVYRMYSVFGFKQYIVVSQQFHNERAIYLAAHFGHRVTGLNARDVAGAGGLKVHIREAGARLKAWMDIHILGTRAHFPGPRENFRDSCSL